MCSLEFFLPCPTPVIQFIQQMFTEGLLRARSILLALADQLPFQLHPLPSPDTPEQALRLEARDA